MKKCYNCNEMGHIARQCTKPKKQAQGKMFALDGPSSMKPDEGKQASVLEGTILWHGLYIRILFDTGASHSFISKGIVEKLKLDVSSLNNSLRVANPVGGCVTLEMKCSGVIICLFGYSFSCDLFIMDSLSYGVILGMDWLERYQAQLYCSKRVITLQYPEYPKRILIALERENASSGYSLYALESKEDEIGQIPVVRDFSDIFEPVTGLPPHRAVEFRIDLKPGTQPFSRPPNRMCPSEMEELRSQIEDLEQKNFIRTSSSTWRASTLFVKKADGSL